MRKITRRQFIKGAAIAGGAMMMPGIKPFVRNAYAFTQSPNLTKFIQPMRGIGGPNGIPVAGSDGTSVFPGGVNATHYTIGITEFQDRLHPQLPYMAGRTGTRLWGFDVGGTQRHLGGIIAAKKGTPVHITLHNNLPPSHIIPVDTTIPGANQQQNRAAIHLHGGLVPWISDGGPFDWWAPNGVRGASFQNDVVWNASSLSLGGTVLPFPNQADYYYPNNQSSRLLWYHDHAFGITRINAYAGIASAFVIYDDYELGLVATAGLPGPLDARTQYLVFQDKIFVDPNIALTDPTWPIIMPSSGPGDLWYAHVYEPARWALGPGGAPPNPSSIPEYFGDTMLVNGLASPFLEVEQRQYRFRMLNACNARFLNPRLVYAQSNVVGSVASTEPSPNAAGPAFVQIANEAGFLPAPAMLNGPKQPLLLLAPAERADLIVDFQAVPAGSVLILYSDAPAPFPKGDGRNDYYPGNPKTPNAIPGSSPNTRTLLQIRVKARTGPADRAITLPAAFAPSDPFLVTQTAGVPIVPVVTPTANPAVGTTSVTLANGTVVPANYRYLTLNETFDTFGRLIQFLGTNAPVNAGAKALTFGREYTVPATEVINAGDYEVWEIANLTGDVHPIHFHLVNVQVLSRQAFSMNQYIGGIPNYQGQPVAPDANEMGWKETVRMNPGEVTRVLAKFDLAAVPFTVPTSPRAGNNGLGVNAPAGKAVHEFVWHCHILEHEEHDMMRPLVVIG